MWKKCLVGYVICLLLWQAAAAQYYYNREPDFLKMNSYWAFGLKAGLRFSDTGLRAVRTAMEMLDYFPGPGSAVREGTAVVSDRNGNLLCYSGGASVWNRNHQPMPQGRRLEGDIYGSTVQGNVFVPVPGEPEKYYLFSLSSESTTPGLYYSVIDMTLDNGLGDVEPARRNIILDASALSEAMIAIPGNACDVWLLTHAKGRPEFKAWRITDAGISAAPVISMSGAPVDGPHAYHYACMAVSPDRSRLIMTSGTRINDTVNNLRESGVLLCDFDPGTGAVRHRMKLGNYAGGGAAFSPDNSKVYIAYPAQSFDSSGTMLSIGNRIVQYDLSDPDPAAVSASARQITDLAGRMLRQYGGRIYVQPNSAGYLHTIDSPDQRGTACAFREMSIRLLSGTHTYLGLPSEMVIPLPGDTSSVVHDSLVFCAPVTETVLKGPPNADLYWWYHDSTSGRESVVRESGLYVLFSRRGCQARIDSFRVVFVPEAVLDLGPDTLVCGTGPLHLQPDIQGVSFLWQDGSTDPHYTVTQSGVYSVQAGAEGCMVYDTIDVRFFYQLQELGSDTVICRGEPFILRLRADAGESGQVLWSTGSADPAITVSDYGVYSVRVSSGHCSYSDTLSVLPGRPCYCMFDLPNAFTPNGDGRNDRFGILMHPECPYTGYSMYVYDRWGRQVFMSEDPFSGWDGTYMGIPAEPGTYMYMIRFVGGENMRVEHLLGDLTLIR